MKARMSLLFISSAFSLTSYAQTPNTGSIIRQAEQQPMVARQTVNTLPMTATNTTTASENNTPIEISNIRLNGRSLISQKTLQPLLDKYIGQTTTFGGLQQLKQQISQAYHKQGYPLVSVVIPPQRLENGELVLQVVEGAVSQVSVNNQSRVSDDVVKGYVNQEIALNQPLKQDDSERALLLVKDLAGTEQVSYQIDGNKEGTNLIVNLEPKKAIDGYVSVDNYGSESTGELRTRAGVNFNSPTGRGEQISLEAMSSFKGINFARLSGEVPIGYQGVTATLGAKHTQYDLGGDFKDLDATGTSDSIDIGLRYPIIRSNQKNVWATTNAEYRDLQDEVGSTNTTTDKSIKAINVGLNGYQQDSVLSGGYTQWSVTNTLGSLAIESADARAIDASSAKTDGGYYKLAGSINRAQYLAPRFSVHGGVQGQWANKNLDSSEQISLGGVSAVSAYHSNDVSGDMGVIGTLEARYDFTPHITMSAFYDAGRVKLRDKPYTAGDNTLSLYGSGIGLYGQYKDLALQGKVAWQGGDEEVSQDDSPRVWVNATYKY